MLIEGLPQTRRLDLGSSDPRPAEVPAGAKPRRRVASAVAFLAAAGVLLAYALPGGAYDLVVRQEYGIAVWWVLGVGFALGLLPRSRPGWPGLLLAGALLTYAAWTAISLGWTVSGERTTAEVTRVLEYLGVVVLALSLVDRATWRPAAMGLGAAALTVCGLAVASRLAPGAFPTNTLFLPNSTNRLGYPFGYWNALGCWAAMATAAGLAWSSHDRLRARRAAVLAGVPVAVVAVYLSYSRASVFGVALAAIAVLAFSRNRLTALVHVMAAAGGSAIAILAVRGAPEIAHGTGTRDAGGVALALVLGVAVAAAGGLVTSVAGVDRVRPLRWRGARAVALAAACVVVIAGAAAGPSLVGRAWRNFRHPAVAQSAADPASRFTTLGGGRYLFWRAALHAFRDRPLGGSGAGTFEFTWNQRAPDSEFIRNAHSLELESMSELGFPGLLLILAVLATAVAVLARARLRARRTLTAGMATALLAAFLVYVLQASVDWMWQSTAVTVLALGGAAVAAGRLSHRRPRIRWWGRVAVVLAAAGAIAVQVPGLLSTLQLRRSQAAERAGNASLAYSWASAAVSAEPWAASAYEQRGLVLEAAGRLAPAAADMRRAIARESANFRHWLLLSRIEVERGEVAAAARDYERARRLRPHALVFEYAPYFRR